METSIPTRGFSAKFVESLKPEAQAYEIADPKKPGLRLRVLPSGARVFRWYVRSLGRVITIGPWSFSATPGHVTLAESHAWLDRLKAARAAGQEHLDAVEAELRAHLTPAPALPAPPDAETVAAVAEEFYKRRILPHRKRPLAARSILDRDIKPPLGHIAVTALDTRACAAAIERVVDRGATVHASKVLALLKQLLRFAEARGYRVGNPAGPLDPKDLGIETNQSTRWLSAEELVLFWRALDEEVTPPRPATRADYHHPGEVQEYEQTRHGLEAPTRAGLRLLLMTGVRSGELLRARWDEVDLQEKTWTIPVANQKLTRAQSQKAKPFVIPLTPTAVALLEELKRLAGDSPWVLASDQSHDGAYTDKALGRAMRRMFAGTPPLLVLPGGPASPHDLRRSVRTHLGKLRVPLHIVERCLNHSLGRIVQIYDQGDYFEERREALERWDAYVQNLLTPSESKLVVLEPKEQPSRNRVGGSAR